NRRSRRLPLRSLEPQAQKRPLLYQSGRSEVAKDPQKSLKFRIKNNKLRDCVQFVLFVGFRL
ncbi:hypothetical protein, partial [Pseudomonas sp. JV245A]|uniref:hypothetical protein n=1 Tax=Pseudomonas sp. JV245A TaxID=1890668 RepID=UPI0028F3F41D